MDRFTSPNKTNGYLFLPIASINIIHMSCKLYVLLFSCLLLVSACHAGVFNVGNLLVLTTGRSRFRNISTLISRPSKIKKFVLTVDSWSGPVKLREFSLDSNAVNTWDLGSCVVNSNDIYSNQISITEDGVFSFSCHDNSNGGLYVIEDTTGPVFKTFDSPFPPINYYIESTVTIGNQIWIGAQAFNSDLGITEALLYTTTPQGHTFTQVSNFGGTENVVSRMFYHEGTLYFGYGQSFQRADAVTNPFGSFKDVISAAMVNENSGSNPVSAWYLWSTEEIYAVTSGSNSDSLVLKFYKDATGTWKSYSTMPNPFKGALKGVTAAYINGVRKVFVAYKNSIYSVDDTMTSFSNKVEVLAGAGYGFLDVHYVQGAPSCSDHRKNQNETDEDCGGVCGATCADDKLCKANSDCVNDYCASNGRCATPSCSDSAMNQDETDVDCGGTHCSPCMNPLKCKLDADCVSGYCTGDLQCATATCSDTVKNLNETDVDCGGYCGSTCQEGQSCLVNEDCATHSCVSNKCVPTCSDNIKNQGESDVDCGGPNCAKCPLGSHCVINQDCQSAYCSSTLCATPPTPVATPQATTPISSTPAGTPQSITPVVAAPQSSTTPTILVVAPGIAVSSAVTIFAALPLVMLMALLISNLTEVFFNFHY